MTSLEGFQAEYTRLAGLVRDLNQVRVDSVAEREALFRQLRQGLARQVALEDRILFPFLLGKGPFRHEIQSIHANRDLTMHLLDQISLYEVDSDLWYTGYVNFRPLVDEYMDQMIQRLLPDVRRVLTEPERAELEDALEVERLRVEFGQPASWSMIMHGEI